MRQQINLYPDGFETPRVVLSAVQGGAIVGISILLMALISGSIALKGSQLKSEAAAVQARLDQRKSQIESLKAQLEARKPDPVLKNRVSSMERNIQAKQRLIALVSGSEGGNTDGFSAYLRGLSERPVPGLWLTEIQIQNGGTSIGFSGETTSPEKVPVFLKSLADKKSYFGHQFEKLQMSQVSSEEGELERVSFQIRSPEKGAAR